MNKYSKLINKHTGIVNFIEALDKELSDPDVFVVASKTASLIQYGYDFEVSSNGSGAGLTFDNAYNAALGEAIERYGLSVYETSDNIMATYNELLKMKESIIHPSIFQPHNINDNLDLPFAEFHDDLTLNWYKLRNLTKQREDFIPACVINIPYKPNLPNEKIISFAVSTGAACSTSLKDAIVKGVFELIERDAFMIVWRNQIKIPKVNISQNHELVKLFNEVFERPGIEYDIYYSSLDFGIPSFFGVLTDKREPAWGRVVGGACHINPETAIIKTFLELVQGLKWRDHKKKSISQPIDAGEKYGKINSFEKRMEFYSFNQETESAFDFLKDVTEIDYNDIPRINDIDIYEYLINELDTKGLDVLAIDITPFEARECGLYVSKVVIPGLEIMEGDYNYPFLKTTRWQKVPVDLGLKKTQADISNLNPFPHPYP